MVLADIDDDRGERITDELGERCRYVHADVSREGAIDAAVAAAAGAFGGLDCLFNNAGNTGSTGGLEEMDLATFDRTVAVHLRGVFLGIRAAARIMRPQGHGSIINTASVAGLAANYGGHDYSACKAAILQLTRTTANELGEDGVRVNAICPGPIATPIFARAAGLDGEQAQTPIFARAAGLDGEQAQRTVDFMTAALSELAPIRRAGQPVDIAEAALWLASDASSYVNGQAIAVDGGLLTGPLRRQQQPAVEGLLEMLRQSARQAPHP